jgi:hypothetical protein
VSTAKVDFEERLEDWLAGDISLIDPGLLVIGRQVPTEYAGWLDLLCIDARGDLVVVELKRDRTPRDVTAQALDYGSWVKQLTSERISDIAKAHLGEGSDLETAFQARFGRDLPDTLNQSHRLMVVAAEIDPSTERIVHYLSEAGIGINVATFQFFRTTDGKELLARVFLIEPEEVSARVQSSSKRRPNLTYAELREIADQQGVGEVYERLMSGLTQVFGQRGTTRSSVSFKVTNNTVLSLLPGESNQEQGLRFQVYALRLARFLNVSHEEIRRLLPLNHKEWTYWPTAPAEWAGYAGYFTSIEEAEALLDRLRSLRPLP